MSFVVEGGPKFELLRSGHCALFRINPKWQYFIYVPGWIEAVKFSRPASFIDRKRELFENKKRLIPATKPRLRRGRLG